MHRLSVCQQSGSGSPQVTGSGLAMGGLTVTRLNVLKKVYYLKSVVIGAPTRFQAVVIVMMFCGFALLTLGANVTAYERAGPLPPVDSDIKNVEQGSRDKLDLSHDVQYINVSSSPAGWVRRTEVIAMTGSAEDQSMGLEPNMGYSIVYEMNVLMPMITVYMSVRKTGTQTPPSTSAIVSSLLTSYRQSGNVPIRVEVHWGLLLLQSTILTGVLGVAGFAFSHVVVPTVRYRRRRCPCCSFPVTPSGVCPECGYARGS